MFKTIIPLSGVDLGGVRGGGGVGQTPEIGTVDVKEIVKY